MMKLRIIMLLLLAGLTGCFGISEAEITGDYDVDKSVKTSKEHSYKQLSLRDDNTFALIGNDTIHGQWETVESGYVLGASGRKEPQATIRFNYQGKGLTGELRGNIFYFESPNVFDPDYKSVLFVRKHAAP